MSHHYHISLHVVATLTVITAIKEFVQIYEFSNYTAKTRTCSCKCAQLNSSTIVNILTQEVICCIYWWWQKWQILDHICILKSLITWC